MMTKILLVAIVWALGVNAASIKHETKTCVDKESFCENLAFLCGSLPVLKTVCPRTCNSCEGFIDPCSENNGGCNHYCSGNLQAVCSCRPGFKLAEDGKTCVDVNECLNSPCAEGSECVNTVGSFSCQLFNCAETLGTDFPNHYKSDTCCVAEQTFSTSPRKYNSREEVETSLTASTVQWPWVAQVLYNNQHTCGATLVSEKWVVTSAICVNSDDVASMTIVLGTDLSASYVFDVNTKQVKRQVKQAIIHPDSENNDIALLELSEPVEFTDLIQPLKFPCDETPFAGTTCYVAGFGFTDKHSATLPRTIQEVALPVVQSSYCALAYTNTVFKYNVTKNLCAGHLQGGEDACNGFSGSALVCQSENSCQWHLSGILSTGQGCGEVGYPGIYVNVLHYESFIRENLGEDFHNACNL